MSTSTITQLPVSIVVGPTTDYLEIARYTGTPGSLYQAYRITPQKLVANTVVSGLPSGMEFVVSNAGSSLITGVQPYVTMPYSATITAANMVCSPSGSLTIDIWRCVYAQFDGGVTHPVVSDSICGGNPLTISGGTKTQSSLSAWAIVLNQGDILAFNISAVSGVTQATITLYLSRSLS